MTHCRSFLVAGLAALIGVAVACRATPEAPARDAIDRDLLDVTVPQLHRLYADKKYTVDAGRAVAPRSHRSLQRRLRRDRDRVPARGARRGGARRTPRPVSGGGAHGPLWGVPIVIKANTSIKGQVTTAGWEGFTRARARARRAAGCHGRREVQGRRRHHRRARQHARPRQQRHEPQQLVRPHRQRVRRALLAGRLLGRRRHGGGGEHGGARQRHRHRQLDSHAGRDERARRRLSDARPRQHRRHRAARLAARQHRSDRAHGDRRGDRAGGDGRRGSARSAHGGLARLCAAARLTSRISRPTRSRANGSACRRSSSQAAACRSTASRRACPRRRPRSFARPANMPLRPETREMFMKAVEALRAAGAEVVLDDSILPGELREDGEPRGDVRVHAGRHESVPRGVRPGGVSLGRGLSEGRRRAALPVVDRRGGRLPETRRRPNRAAVDSTTIRMPSATTTRRGARCWLRISSRWIA